MPALKPLKPVFLEPPSPISQPSSLSSDPAMPTPKAAREVGYSTAALRKWRREGKGPPFIRYGRSVRYRLSDLRAWQETHVVNPACESGDQR